MSEPIKAHQTIENYISLHPELFPALISQGYKLQGWTEVSKKMPDKRLRRIRLKGKGDKGCQYAYTIVPCDLLPYMTGMVAEVEKALYLKRFGVPDFALTYVFGRNDSYWYRQGQAFGRYNIVGSTIKKETPIPENLLADEKHAKLRGGKCYIATTVANDCVLGAAVSATADGIGLTEAYGTFKEEALEVNADYQPKTVNIDGWASTQNAWATLFPKVITILCFLHAFIKIRSRCKRLGPLFAQIQQQVWDIYDAVDRKHFHIGINLLQQWILSNRQDLTDGAIGALSKLCQRANQFCVTFDHPLGYRTSNMIDRHMEPMARWLAGGRYFHGHLQTAEVRVRSWVLLHNYWPYCPRAKVSKLYHSPAHKLNRFVYRDNWLENLLVSSSCQGFRYGHKKR